MLALLLSPGGLVLSAVGSRIRLARWVWPLGLLILAGICAATVAGVLAPVWQWW